MKKEGEIKKSDKENEKLKREIIKLKLRESGKEFRKEFNRSANTAIIAAFSFLIALAWKDVITGAVEKIEELSPMKGTLVSALIVTFISVIGILITTKMLREK